MAQHRNTLAKQTRNFEIQKEVNIFSTSSSASSHSTGRLPLNILTLPSALNLPH